MNDFSLLYGRIRMRLRSSLDMVLVVNHLCGFVDPHSSLQAGRMKFLLIKLVAHGCIVSYQSAPSAGCMIVRVRKKWSPEQSPHTFSPFSYLRNLVACPLWLR